MFTPKVTLITVPQFPVGVVMIVSVVRIGIWSVARLSTVGTQARRPLLASLGVKVAVVLEHLPPVAKFLLTLWADFGEVLFGLMPTLAPAQGTQACVGSAPTASPSQTSPS